MKLKGVNYDAGSVMYFNWRPDFDPKTVSREIEIIKNDLHCNAIRITGLDIKRLIVATEIALKQGLEVWLLPTIWNKKQDQTLAYVGRVAESAETLRREYPESLVFVVGGELTLFMQGIVEGRNVAERMTKLMTKFREEKQSNQGPTNVSESISRIKAGEHNRLLDKFLQKVSVSVRQVFHGQITYASLLWESVDWNLFDYVGVDHYRVERIKEQYAEMLKPAFELREASCRYRVWNANISRRRNQRRWTGRKYYRPQVPSSPLCVAPVRQTHSTQIDRWKSRQG